VVARRAVVSCAGAGVWRGAGCKTATFASWACCLWAALWAHYRPRPAAPTLRLLQGLRVLPQHHQAELLRGRRGQGGGGGGGGAAGGQHGQEG
jgi:hypothetical protein